MIVDSRYFSNFQVRREDPTQDQIAARTKRIRNGWSLKERARRAVCPQRVPWFPPLIAVDLAVAEALGQFEV